MEYKIAFLPEIVSHTEPDETNYRSKSYDEIRLPKPYLLTQPSVEVVEDLTSRRVTPIQPLTENLTYEALKLLPGFKVRRYKDAVFHG